MLMVTVRCLSFQVIKIYTYIAIKFIARKRISVAK